MTNYLIFYGIFFLLLIFKLWWDTRARKKGRVIDHAQSALIDVTIWFIAGWNLLGFWDMGAYVFSLFWLRWLLFDLGWNWIHKKDPFYCGDSSKLDQWADEFDGIEDNICRWSFRVKLVGLGFSILLICLSTLL